MVFITGDLIKNVKRMRDIADRNVSKRRTIDLAGLGLKVVD